MSKFTPGPWHWDEQVPERYLEADWSQIAPWLVDEDGNPVLEGQIACKNAKDLSLIASAPDLLEALEGLLGAYTALDKHITGAGSWHDHARAAIAKAGGEA